MKLRILNKINKRNIEMIRSFINTLNESKSNISIIMILDALKRYSNKDLTKIFLVAYSIYTFQFPNNKRVKTQYYKIVYDLAFLCWEYQSYQMNYLGLDGSEHISLIEFKTNKRVNVKKIVY